MKHIGYMQSIPINEHGLQMHKDNQMLEENKIQLAADCSKEKFRVMQQSAGYQQLQVNVYIYTKTILETQ